MYCAYLDRRELEDHLYQEDEGDSDGSEANSELEFHLYSQLHYSSNARALEEQEDRGETAEGQDSQQPEGPEKAIDADGEGEHTGESRSPSPDLSKLQQLLKEKKEDEEKKRQKQEKLNKQKMGNPKSPRSASSFFEEVIVIDSSPDVISISENDTDDDDEGVCSLKGQNLRRRQTSTPAQQGSKKLSLSAPVTVDSSTSASDSDSSDSKSESSDSDVLENWMILGQGTQDGDQCILLNLDCGSDSNKDAEEEEESVWLVSTKDKESRIYNRDKSSRATPLRMSNRYYTNKDVQCRNCNKNGHLSNNCPEPKKLAPCYLCGITGHLISGCPKKHCNNCGLPGHRYSSCSEMAHWQKRCKRCCMTGHLFDACPEIWRQYHITTTAGAPARQRSEDRGRAHPVYCYNCSRKGHFGHVCKWKRMFNGTYPSSPIINYYDLKKDFKHRENWIMSKVKELKKKGFFLTTSFRPPPTPEPPSKIQKVGHHHLHHRPNHVFFNDSDFVEAAAPKSKKNNKHKQQESHVKPWKPKRPVPTSKDRPPAAKLIVDEAKDFPRGGGKGKDAEKKRKRLSNKKRAPSAPPEAATSPQGSPRVKRNKKSRGRKNKKAAAQMYPADENLFIIKQRKGKK
ncbi:zinc finger CCHC domain-containing protein 7 [Cyclopterus lumpus]|uniref:Zinc finger CCHC domain-containing protein 7 n=1 Tax=Cyclopterus lumpus TaxID=8103 RepID=A0A8C2W7F9_CYCLU|nr:zinc finger CCHC domain-containing protein 7 [Cyclopterus lumpus]XP_034389357.1 zinc finger CCHC domain-containing protein 7 [Cyclopterus lumpus]XP_034389364.1 zinc finger CCHC domain-containing protein 7 [Cyclopterus lumpus]XP_034389373.1 zinc finger CCHC domain-containing protein 7 [Cyclopterus lumpus]